MNQTELNIYWVQTILYYCFEVNNGSEYFDTWATSCGAWGYDGDNNLYIVNWYLDDNVHMIPQPNYNILMSYDVETVVNFHNQNYIYVNDIINYNQSAYYFASSSQLNSIPPQRLALCDGFRAFNTTINRLVFWNNSTQQWQES